MSDTRPENRGPAAAGENRRALLAAALEVFADGGIDAPLSAVARKAGVGQGSLYRHFPDRTSLALAVFEDNVAELEALAADPASTLDDLVALLTDQTIRSVAFVDILTATSSDPRVLAVAERVRAALAQVLDGSRGPTRLRPVVTADDVLLAVGMVAAVVARTPAAERRAVADRAWSLLDNGLLEGPTR
ncbi:transcriptional regulator [Intrasporangium oryzae NRRL B-24470]|uniref:Transcriptional regulator n=1 Tax=Intrasporangium oryzae NRRL B-24470 TaxID=1386089 RepID=W9GF13_9MICO|nr:TetR/AcrR family transcriptional regulator [Intrasporangium oryzae]EWT02459.1 transcriptional regulator [Intrasporangium oryzae NRRL B-24470]